MFVSYLVSDVELWLTAVAQTQVAVWPLPVEKLKLVTCDQCVNRTVYTSVFVIRHM